MTLPTEKQVREEAARFAVALGGQVNLTANNLAESVDAKYPGMTDDEFKAVRSICATVADQMRADALQATWGPR